MPDLQTDPLKELVLTDELNVIVGIFFNLDFDDFIGKRELEVLPPESRDVEN